jgi:hypothetical protein
MEAYLVLQWSELMNYEVLMSRELEELGTEFKSKINNTGSVVQYNTNQLHLPIWNIGVT